VIANATELNVDPACIILCGESGGAGTVLGAAYQLAKLDETHLVKNLWLQCPMLSHETDRVPYDKLNLLEKVGHWDIKVMYQLLATD
jgi:acetyl esterase/lipase